MKQQLQDKLDYILASTTPTKELIEEIYEIRKELDKELTDEERTSLTNYIRNRVQREATIAVIKAGEFGAIDMATGAGKSRIAVMRATDIVNDNAAARVILLVPTEILRDEGWKAEFTKWGQETVWNNNIEAICYASISDLENRDYDLVIADEYHNITENNSRFFKKNRIKSCILLSATKPRDQVKSNILSSLNYKTVYELSTDECVKLGLVAPYDIDIITMRLDDVDKYIKAGNAEKSFFITEKKQYDYLSKVCLTKPTKFNMLKRMRFIYNLRLKTKAAMDILENCIPNGLRTLIFCGSIKQSIFVCNRRYFSKPTLAKKDKANPEKVVDYENLIRNWEDDKGLNDFRAGLINRLSCVEALNEGLHIGGLDIALILQVNSNEKDLVQRIGRIITYRPGFRGKIIILCVVDTVDEKWVKLATTNLNSLNINRIELSRLKAGIETINFN